MTKFYAEDDNGNKVEFGEIQTIDEAAKVLLFFCNRRISGEDNANLSESLMAGIGKTCIFLDNSFDRVLGVK